MKTADIVKTANGYYWTRRYCGQNKGAEFFPNKKKGDRKYKGEKAATEWGKDWTGEESPVFSLCLLGVQHLNMYIWLVYNIISRKAIKKVRI